MRAEIFNLNNERVGGYSHGNIYHFANKKQPKDACIGTVGLKGLDEVIGRTKLWQTSQQTTSFVSNNLKNTPYRIVVPVKDATGETAGFVNEWTGVVWKPHKTDVNAILVVGKVDGDCNLYQRIRGKDRYVDQLIGEIKPIVTAIKEYHFNSDEELNNAIDIMVKHAAGAMLLFSSITLLMER